MKKILVTLALVASSCYAVFAQTNDAKVFTSKELGWSITIPEGWEDISEETLKQYEQKGQEMVKQSGNAPVDMSKVRMLAMFRNGRLNSFQSTIEPMTGGFTLEQTFRHGTRLIYEMLQSQGLTADTSTGKETINGREYLVLNTTLSTAQAKNIAQQTMYYRQIGMQVFTAAMLYNSETNKNALMNAFKNSAWK